MSKAQFVEEIKGLGKLYLVYDSYDNQVPALRAVGIDAPESVRDASYVRLHGKTQNYTRTCHAPILAKDAPVIVARRSPALDNPKMLKAMVEAHRAGRYPVLDTDKSIYREWEQIAEHDKRLNPAKRRAIIIPQREDYRIHRDSDEAKFFWQDMIKLYFKKRVSGDSVPAYQVPVGDVDSADGTIVNFVGFGRPEDGSGLDLGGGDLDGGGDDEAFGVLRGTSEAGSQKIARTKRILPYTPKDIANNLAIVQRVREGRTNLRDVASELEKVVEFLLKLKH